MDSGIEDFSLLGGPLHRPGARCALVRGATNTVKLGLALGWVPWLVLVLLALALGATKIFSLPVVAVHARLLLAVPLLFVAETALDAKFREFVTLLVRSGVAGEDALPKLKTAAGRLLRWKELVAARCGEPACRRRAVAALGADAAYGAKRARIQPSARRNASRRGVVLVRLSTALSFLDVPLGLAARVLVGSAMAAGEDGPPTGARTS